MLPLPNLSEVLDRASDNWLQSLLPTYRPDKIVAPMIDITHLIESDIIIEVDGYSSLVSVVFEQSVKFITADEFTTRQSTHEITPWRYSCKVSSGRVPDIQLPEKGEQFLVWFSLSQMDSACFVGKPFSRLIICS